MAPCLHDHDAVVLPKGCNTGVGTLGDGQTGEAVVSICRHISVAACYAEHANLSIITSIEGLLPMWLHVYGPDWTRVVTPGMPRSTSAFCMGEGP